MRRLFWIPLLGLVGIAPMAYTQGTSQSLDVQRAKQVLTLSRRQFVESSMDLTEAQKDAFWTIYREYEANLAPVSQQHKQLAQEYRTEYTTLTNAQVKEMIKESTAINKKAIELRYKYAEQIGKKIGPKVGARFYQIDDYYTTATRLDALDNVSFIRHPK